MQTTRSKLLIVLAFLTVVSATVWVDARAGTSLGQLNNPDGGSSSTLTNPGVAPSTGEPDGSGGPGIVVPPPPKFGMTPGDGESAAWQPWSRTLWMAGRIWAARVFGVWLR